MRVLVTGAAGFVGSHCIEALTTMPDVEVLAACRTASKLPKTYKGEVKTGDLKDQDYLDDIMRGADVVIHAGAWSSLFGHKKQSEEHFLKPSLNVLETAKRLGVKRFILISSSSVAAPKTSHDPLSKGTHRHYWPHEVNLVKIEDTVRSSANADFCTVNLRLGLFAGARYSLGLLPILVPRLKTHLVPWVAGGKTSMPIVDGRDIGMAAALCATAPNLNGYDAFNIAGPEIPTVRAVLNHLHDKHNLPRPHFSVPFPVAFAFAGFMELLNSIVPWEPLVTRSIIHLMQETNIDNTKAREELGYKPQYHWTEAVDRQMAEMAVRQKRNMRMAKPMPKAYQK